MADLKPLTVYVHSAGPNPYKVTIVLEELNIPYNKIVVEDPKEDWFLALNPNGRVPAITDPNNDKFVIWESGAILEYLVELYDKDGKLTVEDPKGKWLLRQYLHFQMSGQGPYFGQAVWFHRCPDDIPIAKDRYIEQTVRVFEVLDIILKDKEYLLGNKWQGSIDSSTKLHVRRSIFRSLEQGRPLSPIFKEILWEKYNIEERFPNFLAWHTRLSLRPAVKKAYREY